MYIEACVTITRSRRAPTHDTNKIAVKIGNNRQCISVELSVQIEFSLESYAARGIRTRIHFLIEKERNARGPFSSFSFEV